MTTKIDKLSIHKDSTLRTALKQMDEIGHKLLIVIDNNYKFYSLLSIGDIQRAIIKNVGLNEPITKVLRKNIKVAFETDNLSEVKKEMEFRRNELMPVIKKDGSIKEVIFWEELFAEKERNQQLPEITPVVIMAGGKGKRMKPLTNVLPKPLIPLGNKSIIEEIMEKFGNHGVKNFYISLNYKADLIQNYLEDHAKVPYQMHFFRESKPLGTAGSLYLLKEKIHSTFFVTNCDILIDQDYADVYHYHKENKNALTVLGAIKNYYIPYGTMEIGENGKLNAINEKPEIEFYVNSGVYLLEKEILDIIPENEYLDITVLINSLLKKNKKIGVFPVSEKSWKDIGTWEEYVDKL